MRRATLPTFVLALLAAAPAMAESQSSNSSSNCSNGRCSRVESLIIEDAGRTQRWIREERWREGSNWQPRRERDAHARHWHEDRGRRRGRDDDDD